MQQSLNQQIYILNEQLLALKAKVENLEKLKLNPDNPPPRTTTGGVSQIAVSYPINIKSGRQRAIGGHVIWNNMEGKFNPINTNPPLLDEKNIIPYNIHHHNRFTGGALIYGEVDIMDIDWTKSGITNKYTPQYWDGDKIVFNQEDGVDKVGKLDLIFNSNTKTWGCAALEIDVEKCYFVKRLKEAIKDGNGNVIIGKAIGDIETDEKGIPMRSVLYSTKEDPEDKAKTIQDTDKSSVIWDINGKCWRLLAVYAPGEPEPKPKP